MGEGVVRYQDWPQRLDAEVARAVARTWKIGAHDCVSFARACVVAVTGDDPLAGIEWRTRADMRRLTRDGLAALATEALGPPIGVARAQRGDVVLLPHAGGESIGVCLGRTAAFADAIGLRFVQTLDCSMAWRIG